MSTECFHHLLEQVKLIIEKKKDTNLCKSIPAVERLATTLRFLETGDSQQSRLYGFLTDLEKQQ